MNAREEFEAWLRKWDVGHAPHTYELLDAVLRQHAHLLAEKIRAGKCSDTSPDGMLCPCGAAAADLIDPGKQV